MTYVSNVPPDKGNWGNKDWQSAGAYQESLCPNCGVIHKRGAYIDRVDLRRADKPHWRPADVLCGCGALLRHFFDKAVTNGWRWIVVPEAEKDG